MRIRLLPLVCAIVFIDTMLFASIVPLVPMLTDELGLTKLQAGLVVGAYGAGAVIGGIPSGYLAMRVGAKRTAVVGLLLLAAASVGFALADGAGAVGITRFAQGFASAVTWSGALAWITSETPRERRGQTLGTAFGFAVLGFIVGPVVGAAAELTSIRGVFLAVAATTAALALVAAVLSPDHTALGAGATSLRRALCDAPFVVAVWLTVIPALFFGALDLLAPLVFDDAGWSSVAIAAAFVVAGLIEVALAPAAGRLSDVRGRLTPVRMGLWALAAVALLLALSSQAFVVAALIVCASVAVSGVSTPGIALVSDRAEATGLPLTLGYGVMNSAWASGAMLGPVGAGVLAATVGDAAPYLVCAAIAVVTVVWIGQSIGEPQEA